jgi:hypothetical protein
LPSKQSRVGPLSGKVFTGTVAYIISFVGFGLAWRGRDVNLRGVLIARAVLLALGFALTFPPIFAVFAPE